MLSKKTCRTRLRRLALFILPLALLPCFCAHQISPGGGPEDKTGPTVLSSEPLSGAVNVALTNRIVFTFSEWISRATAPRSVTILPPIGGGAKVRVAGRRLEITPASAFAESTTYHVVVTSQLADLRNNPLASSFTLVFSTGPMLDSGRLAGCVVDPVKPPVMAIAALYRQRDTLGDSALFAAPDYLTQTDSAAFFSFENIRVGPYRMAAFVDQNNNRRLDPGKEVAYAPASSTLAVGKGADTIKLFPVSSDTVGPRLSAVAPLSATTLMAALTQPVDSAAAVAWTIERIDRKGDSCAVSKTVWINPGRKRCVLYVADSLVLSPYRLLFRYSRTAGSKSVIVRDSMRFNGSRPMDTVRPALTSVFPPTTAVLPREGEIRLGFSEPVSLTARLALIDSLLDTVGVAYDSAITDTVVAKPVRRLHAGSKYRLVLLTSFGKDLAGNFLHPRDTTDTVRVLTFSVIDPDSIAVSLKGCIPCLSPDSLRLWQFLPLSQGAVALSKDSSGCFSFDSIPAGKGFVAYFTDVNGNKKPDRGFLIPWRSPERYFVLPDTIEARARWEIEDVKLSGACKGCTKFVPAQKTGEQSAKKAP